LVLRKPVITEELAGDRRKPLDRHFVMLADASNGTAKSSITTVGFEVAAHDPNHGIVIGPQFLYSSYLGGENTGNLAGLTIYAKYITVSDVALDAAAGFDNTAYIAGAGTLLYSTFVGGSGIEVFFPVEIGEAGTGIKVDGNNKVWVTGVVASRSVLAPGTPFPGSGGTTIGCFQDSNTFIHGPTGFGPLAAVVVFNLDTATTPTTIPFLTFVPGDLLDVPAALVDASNNLYVTGLS
jgi:hypothetical protein